MHKDNLKFEKNHQSKQKYVFAKKRWYAKKNSGIFAGMIIGLIC